jgi:hypothetical protein
MYTEIFNLIVVKTEHSLLILSGKNLFYKSYKQSTASNFVINSGYINKWTYIRMANNLNYMKQKVSIT